ncbi:SIR2 family protein [Kitasatospora indigofera]|uniref:SIR2 family protein n=1 Tax=Kitasatospora indigofera TaxID=67307 RepID=UPI00368D459A
MVDQLTDPHVTLALSLRSLPDGYAVLLGAGASISAGMPSAWDVQCDLIRKVAEIEGTEIPDTDDGPYDWYVQRYEREPAYDTLLADLAKTSNERHALLRSYFEADETERENGIKRPAAVHRALARMVASGHIKVIVTLNFDHLIEDALVEAGLKPTIIKRPDDLTGMLPLRLQNQGVVVHLHGDYTDPAGMCNTPEELAEYTPETNQFLDELFNKYGLVIAGWSAKYDPALGAAIKRCPIQRFTTYWADPFPLSEAASELLRHRQGTYVPADADRFLGQTADALTALVESKRASSLNIAAAIATAKRELATPGLAPAINLHDALRLEARRIVDHPLRMANPDVPRPDLDTVHAERLAEWEAETEKLAALVAVTAYWGHDLTDRYWLPNIERLASITWDSGITPLNQLRRTPATMLLYSAGTAAIAAERWQLTAQLLTGPQAQDIIRRVERPAAALLGPETVMGLRGSAPRLHRYLSPLFSGHLVTDESAFTEAWEMFDYLRLLVQQDTDDHGEVPYLRVSGTRGDYRPLASTRLDRDLAAQGTRHPLLAAGFLGGDLDRITAAQKAVDRYITQWVDQINSTTSRIFQNGPFYPNTPS